MSSGASVDPKRYYSAAEARAFLGVTEETIKDYCRKGSCNGTAVKAKQMGPRKQWHMEGASIQRILKVWGVAP